MENYRLPSLSMIAGSSHPITFQVTDFSCLSVDGDTVTGHLSVSQYINENNLPLFSLTKIGLDEDGFLNYVIPSDDTIGLHGKFIYQLHLTDGTESEIYEGYLTILENRNKSVCD